MNLFGLDAAILFALSVPLVMKYRILPIDGTPYWLFGIFFLLLVANVLLSFQVFHISLKLQSRLKKVCLWSIISIALFGVMITAIVDRSRVAPVFGVHDIILQQEAAMRFLLTGKNPYQETYFGTPLEEWHYAELGHDAVNPALYHFVMPPFYFLAHFPVYLMSIKTLHFFDARMVLILTILGSLVVISRWFKNEEIGKVALIFCALSPATVEYLIEGRSDAFAFFWIILALFLLDKKKMVLSSAVFGLALMSKQTIWFIFPLYGYYVWLIAKPTMRQILIWSGICFGVVLAFSLPFLLWNMPAFLTSTVLYVSGGTAYGYPVSGYGLGMVLLDSGIITDIHAYYPFFIWQGALGIPAYILAFRWLRNKPTISALWITYGCVLTVIWYTSRYFNNSHVGFIASVMALGILKNWDEKVA